MSYEERFKFVRMLLEAGWSDERIIEALRRRFPDDFDERVARAQLATLRELREGSPHEAFFSQAELVYNSSPKLYTPLGIPRRRGITQTRLDEWLAST